MTDEEAFELFRQALRKLEPKDQATVVINVVAWFMLGVKEELRSEAWEELKVCAQECMRNSSD